MIYAPVVYSRGAFIQSALPAIFWRVYCATMFSFHHRNKWKCKQSCSCSLLVCRRVHACTHKHTHTRTHVCSFAFSILYLSIPYSETLLAGLWSMSVRIESATPHSNDTVFTGRSVNSTMCGRQWQSLAELPRAEHSDGSQNTISVA